MRIGTSLAPGVPLKVLLRDEYQLGAASWNGTDSVRSRFADRAGAGPAAACLCRGQLVGVGHDPLSTGSVASRRLGVLGWVSMLCGTSQVVQYRRMVTYPVAQLPVSRDRTPLWNRNFLMIRPTRI